MGFVIDARETSQRTHSHKLTLYQYARRVLDSEQYNIHNAIRPKYQYDD